MSAGDVPAGGAIATLLRMLQFADSTLPVGAFAFSNGLESAIAAGLVHDVPTLRAFVTTAVEQAAAGDGIALLHAHRAALEGDLDALAGIDRTTLNRKLGEERRAMTVRMGKKLAELGGHVLADPLLTGWLARINRQETPGTWPVTQGLLWAALGAAEADAFAAHQYGVAAMMLGAAVRLMRVSFWDTQAVLFALNAAAPAAYARASRARLGDMAAFAPLSDILAAVHVKAHVRLFMN
jgi:urease accessory protein